MRFSTISLFPEIIRAQLEHSIAQKALDKGLFDLYYAQIRDHAVNRYGQVDDRLYGGGRGMLLMAEPIYQSARECQAAYQETFGAVPGKEIILVLSPRGQVFTQAIAEDLATYDHVIFISGHYEGIDQRVIDKLGAKEISIGDYVLTGGELATCVLIDATMRLLPGVLPDASAWQEESHSKGLLEEDQYTRPEVWREQSIPKVLLSGHDAKIKRWRLHSSLKNTLRNRPDMLTQKVLSRERWLQYLEDEDE